MEYILLVALIALAVIAAVVFMRDQISDKFDYAGIQDQRNAERLSLRHTFHPRCGPLSGAGRFAFARGAV